MKKLVSLFLVVILIMTTVVAFADDYSSMTDEQLKDIFNAVRNELTIRGFKAEKKTVILDKDGLQVYINGDAYIDKPYSWSSSSYLYIPIVVVNNSSNNINIRLEDSSLNGWSSLGDVDGGTTPAGKKSKATISFNLEDADIEELSDFTDVEFSIVSYNTDTYMNIFKSDIITIYAE